MSDIDKLMTTLSGIEDGVRDYKTSADAERKALQEGVAAVQAEIDGIRKQAQTFAEMAKRREQLARSPEAEGNRAFGEQICKLFKGGGTRAASIGTDADGGYVTEPEQVKVIRAAQNQYGLVRQIFAGDIYPMMDDIVNVPVDTYEDASGNTPEPAATSENGAITESDDAQLDRVQLNAQKYATLNYVSAELVQDAFVDFIGAYLTPKIGRRFAKKEDTVVFNTASTGLLDSANVLSVTMDSGETNFGDLTSDYLLDLIDQVVDDALNDGGFIAHRSVISLIRKLKGTDDHPIWTPLAAGEPPTVHGYPISRGSALPASSASAVDKGFILFGDVRMGCVVGQRAGLDIATSEHYRFNQHQVAVRATERFAFATNANIGRALCRLVTAAQ